jgi:hypothetical protein
VQIKTSIHSIFDCSLERAFKSPMLCDVCKVHSGFGPMPKVTHCTEDEGWGKPGGSRKVFMEKSIFFKGGEALLDTVIERVENKYWIIEVSDFKLNMLGLTKFRGKWITTEMPGGKIRVDYCYTLFSDNAFQYPFHWLFAKLIWRVYMKHVLENVRQLAYSNAPYLQE